jgi:hypothetical protein
LGQIGPVGDIAGRVTRNVTSRIVSKLAGLAVAALLAAVGLKQCGKPGSREQVAGASAKVVDLNTTESWKRIHMSTAFSPGTTVQVKVKTLAPTTLRSYRSTAVTLRACSMQGVVLHRTPRAQEAI